MKKIIWLVVFTMCITVFMSFPINAASDIGFSWYCVRNKQHKQPRLDPNMSFIENYDGYYIDRSHNEGSEDKVVYLTFDAGYENGNIEKILNTMREEKVTGAFFILGNLINKSPELVRRMSEEGHIVANHTNSHRDMSKVDDLEEFSAELKKLEALYEEVIGKKLSNYYRPPEGRFNKRSLEYAKTLGYKTIFWSFAYADWDNGNQPDVNAAKEKILDNIHNGAIILLHPTSKTNAIILPDIIKTLKADGYRFGTLDELTGQ